VGKDKLGLKGVLIKNSPGRGWKGASLIIIDIVFGWHLLDLTTPGPKPNVPPLDGKELTEYVKDGRSYFSLDM
jgi:hypothetical protein